MTSKPHSTTDKPRKIIVCHVAVAREIQAGLVAGGTTDALVKPSPFIDDPEVAYVMEPTPDALPFKARRFEL